MHLIIVEDLTSDRSQLAALLHADCAAQGQPAEISAYESGEAFLACYRPGCCDGVFLDILLGGMTGIQIAEKLREQEPRLPIIFTTTEPGYALDGFSVHATDFLVKPVDAGKISWCMQQLRGYLAAQATVTLPESAGRGHINPVDVPLDDILYGRYANHCTEVHAVSGVYVTRLPFQDFIALLPDTGQFYVCGRGLVANLSQVIRVGNGELRLKNGETLPFSRRRKPEVQKAFSDWLFIRTRKGGWA